MSNYRQDAIIDARATADNFEDEILESFMENGGKADDDLYNHYRGDSYHHENHVDKAYNLQEAAELLDELNDYEETDSGLWQGLDPRAAISAQAAYTYGNAVMRFWFKLIEEINDNTELAELYIEHEAVEDALDDELEENEKKMSAKKRKAEIEKRQAAKLVELKAKLSEIIEGFDN